MHESPSLSILIPTWNEESWIAPCIRTIRASLDASDLAGEIIVCDGGSSDETEHRAHRAGVDMFVRSERPGRPRQLNRGVRKSKGECLVFLHADALVHPEWFEALASALRVGHVGGWSHVDIVPEHGGRASWFGLPTVNWGMDLRTRLFHTATSDQGIFMRREAFEAIGGVPELPIMEGYALVDRLREVGSTALLEPRLRISGRRWECGGVVRTTMAMQVIRAGFALDVDPRRLEKWWRQWTARSEA